MSAVVVEKAKAWLAKDPDGATRNQLRKMIESDDREALAQAFEDRLAFGTAGLRGLMGVGPNNMNRLVIRETTAGLALFLKEAKLDQGSRQRVIIAYDGRHGSKVFASDAAGVLAAFGVDALLFDTTAPTPLCGYAVKKLGTAAGIVVTASHNPPAYNGYKVYRRGGTQINDPVDGQIAQQIAKVAAETEAPQCLSLQEAETLGRLSYLSQEMFNDYINSVLVGVAPFTELSKSEDVGTTSSRPDNAVERAKFGIAYTPLHGVGAPIAEALLARRGFTSIWTVAEQREPDGNFPTVEFPNPEEPGATDLVMMLADAHEAQIAIANDPDADRLCACARDGSGKMRQLTGDQLGSLLGDALLERAAAHVGNSTKLAVRSTIVSSRILARLAQRKGDQVEHKETLTGFKWLGPAAERATQRGERFVFGYEEALGYMVCDVVYDKDGLSGLVAIAELAYALHRQGLTLWDRLEEIHRAVGLSITMQRTIKLKPGSSGSTIMKRLRSDKPKTVGSFPLALVDDLIERPTKAQAGEEEVPRNDVLRYYVGAPEGRHTKEDIMLSAPRIIVRPSGTEPKVKIYCEMLGTIGSNEAYAAAETRVTKDLTAIVDAFHHWMSGEAPSKASASSASPGESSLVQKVFSAFPVITFPPAQQSATLLPKKHTTVLYVAAPHPGPRTWASRDPSCLAWQMQLLFRNVDFVCEHIDEDAELMGGLGKLPFVVLANGNRVGTAQLGKWADHFAPLPNRSGSGGGGGGADTASKQTQAAQIALWSSLIGGPILAGVLLEMLSLRRPHQESLPVLSHLVRSSLSTSRDSSMRAEIGALQRHQRGPTSRVPGWKTTLEGLFGSGPTSIFSTGAAPEQDEEDEGAWLDESAELDENLIRRDAIQAITALAGELEDTWRDTEEDVRWVDGQGRLDASLFAILHTVLSLPIDAVSQMREAVLEQPVLTKWTRRIWSSHVKARGG